jgi:hypothetical protein
MSLSYLLSWLQFALYFFMLVSFSSLLPSQLSELLEVPEAMRLGNGTNIVWCLCQPFCPIGCGEQQLLCALVGQASVEKI